MTQIRQILTRVFVDSIDEALPIYEWLAKGSPTRRFSFGEIQLAWVGPFLLLSGPPEELATYRNRVASLIVEDVDAIADQIRATGGQLLDGPGPGPNGLRLIAQHPDGAVFEYLQIVTPSTD